jgi:hypothetical protein
MSRVKGDTDAWEGESNKCFAGPYRVDGRLMLAFLTPSEQWLRRWALFVWSFGLSRSSPGHRLWPVVAEPAASASGASRCLRSWVMQILDRV